MAAINPPAFLQNAGSTHTAEITRMAVAGSMSNAVTSSTLFPRGGVHPTLGGIFAVTQNGTPNMSVNVASGFAVIPGTESSKQAAYMVLNDGTVNVAIAASNPSLPRIDLIALKVQDSFYSGVTDAWSIVPITGTAAGSPVAPALPANAIKIAQIAVGAAVTSIVTANITDSRTYFASAGGLISVANQAERDAQVAHDGLGVWRRDTDNIEVWNGSAWISFSSSFGIVKRGSRNTDSTTTSTEIGVLRLDNISIIAGRQYKIWTSPLFLIGTVAADVNGAIIRVSSSGAATTASTLLTQIQSQTANTTHPPVTPSIVLQYSSGSNQTLSVLLSVFRMAGGTGTVKIGSSVGTIDLVVECIGLDPGDTGVDI